MDLLIGIALGAAFSKFWLAAYHYGKNAVLAALDKKNGV